MPDFFLYMSQDKISPDKSKDLGAKHSKRKYEHLLDKDKRFMKKQL